MGTSSLDEGTTSNRYTIIGRLAGGGMADIYIAKVSSEGGVERHVVLKRVLDTRSRDQAFARMFLDEARLAAQLQHPNIAQVHDVGKFAGSYFFTMEYVHGEDVRALLYRLSTLRRPLPIHHALHIAIGALSALHHAHERKGADGVSLGVVHRDVSPSNVMVAYDGTVKLLDFGVAKATQRTAESHAGTIKGKIAYLSPEQCEGKDVDRRSDIFSVGIMLFEMLTGRRLYKRESDFKAMMAIVEEPPQPPSSRRPDVSPALDEVVLKALAKDPSKRYATAEEMLEALENVASTERLPLSGASMGRFMRELFGERKEPWIELPVRDQDDNLTVTGKSLTTGDVLPTQSRLEPEAQLVAQLASAPTLGRPVLSEESPSPFPGTPPAGVPVRETPVGGIPVQQRPAPAVETLKQTGAATAVAIPSKIDQSRSDKDDAEPEQSAPVIAVGRSKTRDGVAPAKSSPPAKAPPPPSVGSITASWAALSEPSRPGTSPPVRPATMPPAESPVIVAAEPAPASSGTSLGAGASTDAPSTSALLPPPPPPTPTPPPLAVPLSAIPAIPAPSAKAEPPRPKTPTGSAKPFAVPPIAPPTVVEAKPFTGTMPLPNLGELVKAPTPSAPVTTSQAVPEATDDALDRPSRRMATVIGTGGELRPPPRVLRHTTEDGDTIPPLITDPPPLTGISLADVKAFETAPSTEPSVEPTDDAVRARSAHDRSKTELDSESLGDAHESLDGEATVKADIDALVHAGSSSRASSEPAGDGPASDNERAASSGERAASVNERASSRAGSLVDAADSAELLAQSQTKRRQLFFIGGAMAVVIAIGIGVLAARGARSRKTPKAIPTTRDAGIVTPAATPDASVDALTEPAAAEPDASVDVEIVDAAVEVVIADAAVEPASAPDAAIDTPAGSGAAPAPSIADAAAAANWKAVLAACAATQDVSSADAASCVTAACTLKKRTLAVQYARRVGKRERAPLERACKAKGITLGPAPKKKQTGPVVDPCEQNPLKCQK